MSNETFPLVLSRPYAEGFGHSTARQRMGGGREVRAAMVASVGLFSARGNLRVPQDGGTYDTLADFVADRRGGYDTFLYLPALSVNRKAVSEAVGTGDGATTLFALDMKYPKTGTFTVTVNGSASAEGGPWSLSDSGGTSFSLGENPYMKFAVAPTAGHAIVATYDFYVPVTFEDGDDLLARLNVLAHAATSAASVLDIQGLALAQDFPGSHLVAVPTV